MLSVLLDLIPDLAGHLLNGKAKDLANIGTKVAKEVFGTDDQKEVEQLIQLDPKNAETFKAALEIELAKHKLAVEDIQHARDTTVALAKEGSAIAWGAPVVSTLIVLGYFFCTYLLFVQAAEIPSNVFQLLNVMFGTLTAAFLAVVHYWLGSSSGSKRAGDAVRQIATGATAPKRLGN